MDTSGSGHAVGTGRGPARPLLTQAAACRRKRYGNCGQRQCPSGRPTTLPAAANLLRQALPFYPIPGRHASSHPPTATATNPLPINYFYVIGNTPVAELSETTAGGTGVNGIAMRFPPRGHRVIITRANAVRDRRTPLPRYHKRRTRQPRLRAPTRYRDSPRNTPTVTQTLNTTSPYNFDPMTNPGGTNPTLNLYPGGPARISPGQGKPSYNDASHKLQMEESRIVGVHWWRLVGRHNSFGSACAGPPILSRPYLRPIPCWLSIACESHTSMARAVT